MFPTANDAVSQVNRMSLMRGYLRTPGKFSVQRGFNSKLVDALANAKGDPHKPEMVLHNKHSHSCYAIGCALGTYTVPARAPADQYIAPTVQEMIKSSWDKNAADYLKADSEEKVYV